jgi:hypothetical protein
MLRCAACFEREGSTLPDARRGTASDGRGARCRARSAPRFRARRSAGAGFGSEALNPSPSPSPLRPTHTPTGPSCCPPSPPSHPRWGRSRRAVLPRAARPHHHRAAAAPPRRLLLRHDRLRHPQAVRLPPHVLPLGRQPVHHRAGSVSPPAAQPAIRARAGRARCHLLCRSCSSRQGAGRGAQGCPGQRRAAQGSAWWCRVADYPRTHAHNPTPATPTPQPQGPRPPAPTLIPRGMTTHPSPLPPLPHLAPTAVLEVGGVGKELGVHLRHGVGHGVVLLSPSARGGARAHAPAPRSPAAAAPGAEARSGASTAPRQPPAHPGPRHGLLRRVVVEQQPGQGLQCGRDDERPAAGARNRLEAPGGPCRRGWGKWGGCGGQELRRSACGAVHLALGGGRSCLGAGGAGEREGLAGQSHTAATQGRAAALCPHPHPPHTPAQLSARSAPACAARLW